MINNFSKLKEKINKCIVEALEETRKTIGGVLVSKTSDYYDEYEPVKYSRTYSLLDSLVGDSRFGTEHSVDDGKVIKNQSGYSFKVGWSDEYLNFEYEKATGETVLKYYNNETHGGVMFDNNGERFKHRFFKEAIAELGGEKGIKNIFYKNLKKTGLPIKMK